MARSSLATAGRRPSPGPSSAASVRPASPRFRWTRAWTPATCCCASGAHRPEETAGELAARLAPLGASVLLQTLARLDAIAPERQNASLATLAPRLKKEDGWLRLAEPARALAARVRVQSLARRGASGAGRAASWWRALAVPHPRRGAASTLVTTGPGAIALATGDGMLLPVDVQPENRKVMAWEDYLRGARLGPGDRLAEIAA